MDIPFHSIDLNSTGLRRTWKCPIPSEATHQDYYLGLFGTAIEAAKARDAKAIELGGPYVQLNFPPKMDQ